jgi:sec-independent protein translocase protein TatB
MGRLYGGGRAYNLGVNLGAGEIITIVLVATLLLGPEKIPEVARWLAKGYRELARLRQHVGSTFDDVKRDLKIDPVLLDPLAEDKPRGGETGLIRPPAGERATSGGRAVPPPAPSALADDGSGRFLFQSLAVPAEDDYLTTAAPAPSASAAAPPAPPPHAPADAEDYLGGPA